MKKNFETLIKHAGKTEGLSDEKRIRMRAFLHEYAAMQPRRVAPETTPSSWRKVLGEKITHLVSRPVAAAFLILVLLFGTTGSLAFAAEGTVPGDPLYAFKVDVTEPLQGALMLTPAAQAAWQMTLATRRVDEAATLASRGDLSTSTQQALSARFVGSIDAAKLALKHEGTPATNSSAGTTNTVSVPAIRLAAYVKVFDSIARTHPAQETTDFRNVVATAAQSLEPKTPRVMTAATTMHAATMLKASTPQPPQPQQPSPAIVQELQHTVQQALTQANEQLIQNTPLLTASTSERARLQLEKAATRAKDGEQFLTKGDRSAAASAYKESIGITTELDVFLYAAAHLKVDAFGANATSTATSSEHARIQQESHAHQYRNLPNHTYESGPRLSTSTPSLPSKDNVFSHHATSTETSPTSVNETSSAHTDSGTHVSVPHLSTPHGLDL